MASWFSLWKTRSLPHNPSSSASHSSLSEQPTPLGLNNTPPVIGDFWGGIQEWTQCIETLLLKNSHEEKN
jgi:hypothetical protein